MPLLKEEYTKEEKINGINWIKMNIMFGIYGESGL